MEAIIFTRKQFNESLYILKADLIERCINTLNRKGTVKIDGKVYDNLTEGVYWLLNYV